MRTAQGTRVDWRSLVGGLIVVVVVAVIGLKNVQGKGGATIGASARPTQAASALAGSIDDPMPADLAGQLEWV